MRPGKTRKACCLDESGAKRPFHWFAVRVKRRQTGTLRTVMVGGKFETYRDRQDRVRKRRVKGTGTRVFVPEYILRRAGFEVFLPVRKVLRRKTRFSPEKQLVLQPRLVDWMFVGWPVGESRWHELMELDMITGVMGTGGRPVEIPTARIMRLMRQWGGGHLSPVCARFMKTGLGYVAGDTVRVPDGPFADFELKIVDVSESAAQGVISIFGRETPLEIPLENLSPSKAMQDAMVQPPEQEEVLDARLSACRCGFRTALVEPSMDGFSVRCDNCGCRAAVGSQSEAEACSRWNAWRSGRS